MKKILIFSINAGSGHNSVAQAIQSMLQKDYAVTTVLVIKDVLWPLDPLIFQH